MWFVFACSSPPSDEPPKLAITPPPVVAELQQLPPPDPGPVQPAARPGLTDAQRASPWDRPLEPCPEGCLPLQLRVQASSELVEGDRIHTATSAADGDPETAWCGVDGLGDQLSFASPVPFDLRRLHIAGWNGSGPAVTEVYVVTDRGDRFVLELPAPGKTAWPRGGSPPSFEMGLTGIQFLQLEIRALTSPGRGCISEVLIEGHQPAR